MDNRIFIAKWKSGKFSVFIGAGPDGIVWDADSLDDPYNAEIRVLPVSLRSGYLLFDQNEDGSFKLEAGESSDLESALWAQCKKVVWPKKTAEENQRELDRIFTRGE